MSCRIEGTKIVCRSEAPRRPQKAIECDKCEGCGLLRGILCPQCEGWGWYLAKKKSISFDVDRGDLRDEK
jgi:DnaJ-class molecular chaperone